MEKEAEAAAAEHAFAVERERLLRQLVASNVEKQRLTEEVRRLQMENEMIRARLEEVSRSLIVCVCVYVRTRARVCVSVAHTKRNEENLINIYDMRGYWEKGYVTSGIM
jgi:regulator of replication initiation timing